LAFAGLGLLISLLIDDPTYPKVFGRASLGERKPMIDLLMILLLLAAFAGAMGFVRACHNLTSCRHRVPDA